jgi:hypothetical protein
MSLSYKIVIGLILLQSASAFSQGKINVNGATVNVVNAAYLNTYDVRLTVPSALNVNGSTLKVANNITSTQNINLRNGALEMSGANSQTIPVGAFVNNAVNDFIISNTSATGVGLTGAVDVYNSLTYSGTGMKLSTNDSLTIKSIATNTAWVGDMTGNTITGKVKVERFISARKAWRFLSIPTNTGQTIRQAWQEDAISSLLNPVIGYGIQLTGAGGTGAGFDSYSALPSMKTYNSSTGTWDGITGTGNLIKATGGYMTFIRGDRTANLVTSPVTSTTLRTYGPLYTGNQAAIAIPANLFVAIGNPYASAIDMRSITKTGCKDFFYVWDPALAGAYGYGGYQTFSNGGSGNYVITPGGGSYGGPGSQYNYIASGLAFLVQGDSGGGDISFKEGDKTTGSGVVSTAQGLPTPQLRVTLYGINTDKSNYLADGLLINYDDSFSNAVDNMDAIKSVNSSENLSVKTNNKLLVVERRHTIISKDTIFFNLTNVKAQNYRFEFSPEQIDKPGLTAFLEDSYLNTRTPVNLTGTSEFDFNIVNIPGSYAANRFRIVFTPPVVLPVTFSSIKAYPQANYVNIDWNVENEINIKQYEVEKSTDGTQFSNVAIKAAKVNGGGSAFYSATDSTPVQGYNYYRVKSIDDNGKFAYTTVVKVLMTKSNGNISVYPNPISGNRINLVLNNQPEGKYGVSLYNKAGQLIMQKEIHHAAGSNAETIELNKYLSRGLYQLEVLGPDGNKININVIR